MHWHFSWNVCHLDENLGQFLSSYYSRIVYFLVRMFSVILKNDRHIQSFSLLQERIESGMSCKKKLTGSFNDRENQGNVDWDDLGMIEKIKAM